jgi:uncharacterized membrane-anchored protein YitT (DUF2179 family)
MLNYWVQKGIDYFLLTFGAILVAIGLELILAPNNLVDGGVTAIAIMCKSLWSVPIWMVLLGFNLPIVALVAKQLGRRFVVRTLYSNIVATLALTYLAPKPAITSSELLIVLYGGLVLGLGVGIVVKNGGAIDGTEMIAVWVNKRFHVPISTFLLSINAVILSGSAFVFGLEKAMFSIAVFFIVSKSIDMVLDGINRMFAVMIISDQPELVGKVLMEEGSYRITFITATGGYSGNARPMIYCITDRFVYPRLKEMVLRVDPAAILEASLVTEIEGLRIHTTPRPS